MLHLVVTYRFWMSTIFWPCNAIRWYLCQMVIALGNGQIFLVLGRPIHSLSVERLCIEQISSNAGYDWFGICSDCYGQQCVMGDYHSWCSNQIVLLHELWCDIMLSTLNADCRQVPMTMMTVIWNWALQNETLQFEFPYSNELFSPCLEHWGNLVPQLWIETTDKGVYHHTVCLRLWVCGSSKHIPYELFRSIHSWQTEVQTLNVATNNSISYNSN